MSEETKITDLQNIDPKNLPELQGFEEKQKEIVANNPFIEIIDNETYQEAKKRRTALVSARTGLQNQDKVIASSLKALRTRALNFANELIKITLPHEEKQQAEVKRYEAIKEAEKARKEEEERQRILKIRQKIDEFEGEVNKMSDEMTFDKIDVTLNGAEHFLAECKSDFDFQEFEELFVEAGARAMRELNEKVKVLQEKEAQRLENERLAKEAEEARKKAELQSKRISELMPYSKYFDVSVAPTLGEMSQDEYLKIFNSAVNKKAEQDRLDAEAKAEQEKKEAAEAERLAKLDADNKKLAEQQEEIRKKKESENKMAARTHQLKEEFGMVFNYSDAFERQGWESVPVKFIKTATEKEWLDYMGGMGMKDQNELEETPDVDEAFPEIDDEIEEVDFEVHPSIKKEMEEAIIDLGFRINIHAEFEDEKAQLLWNEIVESFKDWIDEQKARIQNL